MFGGYDSTKVDESEIRWMPLTDGSKWNVEVTDASFGAVSLLARSTKQAQIRPGVQGIGFPSSAYLQLQTYLSAQYDFECSLRGCESSRKCEQLDFTGNYHLFTLGFASQPQDVQLSGHALFQSAENGCRFKGFDSGEHFVIGDGFLQSFYAIFDIDNQRIGLSPFSDNAGVPSAAPGETNSSRDFVDIVIGSIIVVALILVLLLFYGLRPRAPTSLLGKEGGGAEDEESVQNRRRRLREVSSSINSCGAASAELLS